MNDWSEVDCDNCLAPIKHDTQPGGKYPTGKDCEFCREEITCSGHSVWQRLRPINCSRTATVFDTEGRDFYCEEGWKILHEGEDLQEMEEFAIRLPK